MELKAGDVFASKNPQGLGKLILMAERIKSQDQKAEYGHCGIIINSGGNTLECVFHVQSQNLFDAYKGQKVIIARWVGMTPEKFQQGYNAIKDQIGKVYPWYRLVLYVVGLARWIQLSDVPVCSEYEDKFEYCCGVPTLSDGHYWGVTPDNKVDEWRISKWMNIVFEGVL